MRESTPTAPVINPPTVTKFFRNISRVSLRSFTKNLSQKVHPSLHICKISRRFLSEGKEPEIPKETAKICSPQVSYAVTHFKALLWPLPCSILKEFPMPEKVESHATLQNFPKALMDIMQSALVRHRLNFCTWVPCPAELSETYLTRYCRSSSRGSSSGKDPWGRKIQFCTTLLRAAYFRNLWKYWYCLRWLWLTSRRMKMPRFAAFLIFQSFSGWSYDLELYPQLTSLACHTSSKHRILLIHHLPHCKSNSWNSHFENHQSAMFAVCESYPGQAAALVALGSKGQYVYYIPISVCFSVSV